MRSDGLSLLSVSAQLRTLGNWVPAEGLENPKARNYLGQRRQYRRTQKEVAMDDLLRRAAGTRAPYNEGSSNLGRFGLLPSLLEEFFQPTNGEPRGNSF